MLYKKGDKGHHVKEIQQLLDNKGYWTYHKITDYYGTVTEEAVENFQKASGLSVDGKVGPNTLSELLEGVDADLYEIDDVPESDTDNELDYKGGFETSTGYPIDRAYLDTDEYVRDYGKITPLSFFIHHTAGWNNPYGTILSWNRDNRGRVGTPYAIGGINIKTGDDKYDGKIVECIPNNYIGWHLGKVGNFDISKFSSAVEINNFGWVEKKDGKFYNYVDIEVPEDMVCDLGYKFRGYQYWHKYTDAQIEALKHLLVHVNEIYPEINLKAGLPSLLKSGVSAKDAFDFQPDAYYGRVHGLWTHTNVRKDKFDNFPQPELVDLLLWVHDNL